MKNKQIGNASSDMTVIDLLQLKEDSEVRVMELLNEINDEFKKQGVPIESVDVSVYAESNFGGSDSSRIHEVKFTLDI